MDDRFGVSIVSDPLKGNMPKPARRLAGDVNEPLPIGFGIPEDFAVGLANISPSNDGVMKSAPVGAPVSSEAAL